MHDEVCEDEMLAFDFGALWGGFVAGVMIWLFGWKGFVATMLMALYYLVKTVRKRITP